MYSANILLDSISPTDHRLTTFELKYPRFVHSELLTHRVFSRNSSSSRAVPIEKMIDRVMADPVMPVHWGSNKPGMQAGDKLHPREVGLAANQWLMARVDAVQHARQLSALGVHKQIVNRLLEPWMYITVILSGTSFGNFFNLRCHPDAQPEIKKIADMARDLYYSSEPRPLAYGQWHMPLLPDRHKLEEDEFSLDDLRKISVGRCARVSYLTHDGKRDPQKDIELCDRLISSGHWSPFEHVARPYKPGLDDAELAYRSNFTGWVQYRKYFPAENKEQYNYSNTANDDTASRAGIAKETDNAKNRRQIPY